MTALEIVARIQEQGHTIRLNGEKVRVEPQLTADLRELLVEYKLEIVALLRSEPCPVQRDDGSWRTVHFDAHIEVDSGYYSAPPTSRSGKTAGRFTVESVPDARVSASSETSTAPRFAAAASTVTRQAKAPIEQRLLAILTAGGPRHGYSRSVLHLTFAGAGKGKLIRARRLLTARGLAVERRESRPNISRLRFYLYATEDDALAAACRVIVLDYSVRRAEHESQRHTRVAARTSVRRQAASGRADSSRWQGPIGIKSYKCRQRA